MRLLSFQGAEGVRLGALNADARVVDLTACATHPGLASMQSLIESGEEGLTAARVALNEIVETLEPTVLHWLAPLPCPQQLRDFLVFEEHMRVAGFHGRKLRAQWEGEAAPSSAPPIPPVWYRQPIYYKGNRFATAGHGNTVCWPPNSHYIDYELELACVIGRGGRDIAAADAWDHIFGYTIFNDLTARDLQFAEMQAPLGPAKGKDFDRANVMGPVIVTADEIGAHPALAMRAYVNGTLWSEGSSETMHWSFAQMIEHVSRSETLHPGEILGSGTVGGGCGLELGRFLQDGDDVALEIERIGRLETRIHAPHVPERMVL